MSAEIGSEILFNIRQQLSVIYEKLQTDPLCSPWPSVLTGVPPYLLAFLNYRGTLTREAWLQCLDMENPIFLQISLLTSFVCLNDDCMI